MGLTAGLNAGGGKNLLPLPESETDCLGQVVIPTEQLKIFK
jgi:hypothetical protein